MRYLGLVLLFCVGCGPKVACYSLMGVNKPQCIAYVFDECRAEIILTSVPNCKIVGEGV